MEWSYLRELATGGLNEDFKSGGPTGKTTEDVTVFSQDLLNSADDLGTSDVTSEATKDTSEEVEDMDDSDKSEKSDITDGQESAEVSVKSTSDSTQNSAKKYVADSVPETPVVSENESVPNVKKKSTMKEKSKKPITRTFLDSNLETAVASGSDSKSREKHSQDSVAIAKPAVEDSGTTRTQGSIKSNVDDSVFTILAQDSVKKGIQDSVKNGTQDSVKEVTQDSGKSDVDDSVTTRTQDSIKKRSRDAVNQRTQDSVTNSATDSVEDQGRNKFSLAI